MNIAIIPARGGSKRIPKKNIRDFAGKPMISYPIRAALESTVFDAVIVTTDSEEIAQVARHWGADVPFLRPAHLADDISNTDQAIVHALNWVIQNRGVVETFCCIYPTAPLLRARDLENAYALLKNENVRTVVSVTKFSFPIDRALRYDENHRLAFIHPQHRYTRSQDLPDSYRDAGMLYFAQCKPYLLEQYFHSSDSLGYELPEWMTQDIDTDEDWKLAEIKYRVMQEMGYL